MNIDSPLDDPAYLLEQDARLRALARRLVQDAALADDVVQETWVRALRGSARVESRLASWLSGIARHVAVGKRRKESTRAQCERQSEPPTAPPSTDELLARETARREVVDAVMRLHESARAVIVLRYFDDRSSRAIAVQLGLPVETVRTRIKRALEQLRRDLDQRHGGDGRAWCAVLAPIVAVPKAAAATVALAIASVAIFLSLATVTALALRNASGGGRDEASATSNSNSSASEPAPLVAAADDTPKRVAIVDPTESDVTGRVIDAEGRPVTGAQVVLMVRHYDEPGKPQRAHGEVVTEADGSFRFAAVPLCGRAIDDPKRDAVVVRHPSFVRTGGTLDVRGGATITLRTPAVLEGTVRDVTTGAPVADAIVDVQIQSFIVRQSITQTTTASHGGYSVLVWPDMQYFVSVRRPGCVPLSFNAKVRSDPRTSFDVTLPPMRSVTFDVRALADGAPRAGIEITGADAVVVDGHPVVLGVTDSAGQCTLNGVPVAGWECEAHDTSAGVTLGLNVPPLLTSTFDAPVSIRVPEPWRARGRVIGPDGKPVAGATVRFTPAPGAQWSIRGTDLASVLGENARHVIDVRMASDRPISITDAEGAFELSIPLAGFPVAHIVATRANEGAKAHTVAKIARPLPASLHDVGAVELGPDL